MKKFILLILVIAILFPMKGYTWNDEITHPNITKKAVQFSNIDAYLQNDLGFIKSEDPNRPGTLFKGKYVTELIQKGSELEDDPMCRAGNHFHNPLKDWGISGLTDTWWPVNLYCYGFGFGQYPPDEISSNITWATGYLSLAPVARDDAVREFNEWDWDSAREYFYTYLTGKDYQGTVVASDGNARDEYMAKCFRAVGQVLHLIQDSAVPAHVRNDFSQGHTMVRPVSDEWPWKWIGNAFELYVKRNDSKPWFDSAVGGDLNDPFLTKFWDTDQLDENYTGIDMNTLGLAEYTNLNFLSAYTMFTDEFPFPKAEHCVIVLDTPPNGIPNLDRQYLSSTNGHPGEQINRLAIVSYLDHFRKVYFPNISSEHLPVYLDSACYDEYASKLIPRAVGYSAGLLDYFFRGSLEVPTCVPFIYDNTIVSLDFKAKNVTTTEETMSEGNFTVVVRYTPADGNPDGSDDKFFCAEDVYCNELQYEDELELTVDLPLPGSEDSISFDVYESIKCYLVFKGTLGAEENAVIGKVFTLGEIKFREDWDNGLDGNHDWYHGQSGTEPVEGGETINNITTDNNQDTLIKENIRNTGVEDGRSNQSALSLDGNEILITPNTFLHFKIDNISVSPPSTIYLQALRIQFTNGTWLQFCPDGQCDYPIDINWPAMDININIDPENSLVVVNIHQLFQEAGIDLPEYLYLRYINFMQLFEEGAGVETTQRMEIDFIRIVEETP